ncbi:MAG: T9SS type A sorting domain-containing protein [Pedobacter sp.]|uniref:T9SS type A sorting domain-containing protein n=1 Tax=Pedobacter sp. TaxID=1411316 RepID=UPI0028085379|nr:T9SS type A sorting domain-containing protein [Pedobacter sp.]MDQ8003498.1 T9SS type A sorting domain-containing protein [Pedobacter sp.]
MIQFLKKTWIFAFILVSTLIVNAQVVPTSNIVYVKENGIGNGSSWATPSSLAVALQWAQANKDNNLWNSSDPLKIYVAKGLHKPSIHPSTNTHTNGRDATFLMVKNVELYGGFPDGGTPTMADRNWTENGTLLDGETQSGFPAYHVVLAVGSLENVVLDGFAISGGHADTNIDIVVNGELVNHSDGGGMLNISSSPKLTNVFIRWNSGQIGGGICNRQSSPSLNNVILAENHASMGGGIANWYSSPSMTNVNIAGNQVGFYGAGMWNLNSSPTLNNISVTGNLSDLSGGGLFNTAHSSPILTNVTISGNRSNTGGSAIETQDMSMPKLQNCIVWGNSGTTIFGLIDAASSHNLIEGTTTTNIPSGLKATDIFIVPQPSIDAPTIAGLYGLRNGSIAINKGSNHLYSGLDNQTKDLEGNSRVYKFDNGGIIDLGAYEFQGAPPILPIRLSSFTAKKTSNTVTLNWQTQTERYNKGFEIERKYGEQEFGKIGFVPGNNIPDNYSFIDKQPKAGVNYYRLKQVDFNGDHSYSDVSNVSFDLEQTKISFFPNPTRKSINLVSPSQEKTVNIYNTNGEKVKVANIVEQQIDVEDLKPGVYFMVLSNTKIKFIKL